MYNVSKNCRITQRKSGPVILNDFSIYNSANGLEIVVDYSVLLFLNEINDECIADWKILLSIAKKYFYKYVDMVNRLLYNKIIIYENKKNKNNNILIPTKNKFLLTKLAIELTDLCNLKCVHCYGEFGKRIEPTFLSFELIKKIKNALDDLHTKSIALTGGECILNPDFEKIALFFLENGFKLTVFTNGYNTEKINSFLILT